MMAQQAVTDRPNQDQALTQPEKTGLQLISGFSGIDGARQIANKLGDIVEKQKLYTMIPPNSQHAKKYVHVDGWATLGSMLGVYPEVISVTRADAKMIDGYLVEMSRYSKFTRKNEPYQRFIKKAMYNAKTMKIIPLDGNDIRQVEEIKYIAEVEIKTFGGVRVGKAIGMCSNLEEGKLDNAEYSISSMAQTRATGKAFRLPFSWIMTLAGYSPTPKEEYDASEAVIVDSEQKGEVPEAELVSPPEEGAAKPEQKVEAKPIDKMDSNEIKAEWADSVKKVSSLGFKAKIDELLKKHKITALKAGDLPKLLPEMREILKSAQGNPFGK